MGFADPIISLLNEDTDRLFSYMTAQQVVILDKLLGIINNLLQVVILCYVILYVFVYDKGYLEYEPAKGITVTHVRGDALAHSTSGPPNSRYFSADEIVYPGLENGNVMVATKMSIKKQKRGVCEDFDKICKTDDDCSQGVDSECTDEGFCKEPSWCPDGDEHTYKSIYKLDTDALQIWIKSSIQFVRLNPKRFFTSLPEPIPYPEKGYNTFSVRELLLLCEPPVRYEEISELGAAVEIQFVWDCNVKGKQCFPHIQARRIDSLLDADRIGFEVSYPMYTGMDTRHLKHATGVRFYFRTVGTGQMLSPAEIILKASTGMSLLGLAPIIVDWLMLKAMGATAKKYFSRKYDVSEDFSELFERRAQEAEAKKQEAELLGGGDEEAAEAEEIAWMKRMDEEDA